MGKMNAVYIKHAIAFGSVNIEGGVTTQAEIHVEKNWGCYKHILIFICGMLEGMHNFQQGQQKNSTLG